MRSVFRAFLSIPFWVLLLFFIPQVPTVWSAGPAAKVEMSDQLKFVPGQVTIRPGEAVEWKNASTYTHTVTADPSWAIKPQNVQLPEGVKPFDSGNIAPGKTYQHTFSVPGTYRYFCIPHQDSGMIGEVLVKP